MKKYIALAVCILISSCSSKKQKSDGTEGWPQKMQELSSSLQQVIPIAFQDQVFFDNSKSSENLAVIKRFRRATHKISKKDAAATLGKDPIVLDQLTGLQSHLDSAVSSFEKNNKKYAQHMLKSSISFCFRCHSRQNLGPEVNLFTKMDWSKLKMNPIEKSEYLMATRQFSEAKKTLKSYVRIPEASWNESFLKDTAIKHYLTIVLRAQDSPTEALRFVEDLTDLDPAPSILRNNIKYWRPALLQWIRKKDLKNLKETEQILAHTPNTFPLSLDWKFIDLLRVSAALHKMTLTAKTSKERSTIYQQLGLVYDRLGSDGFWEVPEVYYENCIRETPHSKVAMQCYDLLERKTLVGFTGSAGTFLPMTEQKRLLELRTLAQKTKRKK